MWKKYLLSVCLFILLISPFLNQSMAADVTRQPRIMVVIDTTPIKEDDSYSMFVETEILNRFLAEGFKIVSPNQVEDKQREQALKGDARAIAVVGKNFGVDLIITGKAYPEIVPEVIPGVPEMQAIAIQISGQAIWATTDEVIVAVSSRGADPFNRKTEALKKAGIALADKMLADLVRKWKKTVPDRREDLQIVASSDKEVSRRWEVALSEGLISSKGIRSQRWAVVIGISDYKYPGIPDLRYAHRDAEAFCSFLKTPQGGGFAEDHIRFLKNEEATLYAVKEAIFDFLKRPIKEDLVIIYFAGHGIPDPERPENLYLLTHDSRIDRLGASALPMWDIETALKRYIEAKRVIVFADACHAGGVVSEGTRRVIDEGNLINRYLLELSKAKPSCAIFTGSEVGELSHEAEKWGGGHGVFTYYLLEGLKGKANMDFNKIVTLGEVIDYVDEQVRRATNNKQHPDTAGHFDRDLPMSVLKDEED